MPALFPSNTLDAENHGAVFTGDAVAGLAYYFSGHDYLDVPDLDVSPRIFPQITFGAWVKVRCSTTGKHLEIRQRKPSCREHTFRIDQM